MQSIRERVSERMSDYDRGVFDALEALDYAVTLAVAVGVEITAESMKDSIKQIRASLQPTE